VTRLASGVVLIAIVGSAAWWGPPALITALAAGVAAGGAIEFAALAAALGAPAPRVPLAIAATVITLAIAWPGVEAAVPVLMAVALAFPLLAVGRGVPAADALGRVAAPVFGALYVGLPLGALMAVRWAWSRETMLVPIAAVVVSDTAQYYTGRAFGRRPLSPALSPKKTIEGALGGLVIGTAAFVALTEWWWPPANLVMRVAIGAAIVALGMCGDLFESLLKRAAGVKDSSSIIPGHGGVLDRIDALLFVTPFYYIVLRYLVQPA
jgi:phosphatidate cytidylyltransferase